MNNGYVSIAGDEMLFVTLDDKSHSVFFYNKRGASESGAALYSYQMPQSLTEDIKRNAVSQQQGKLFSQSPQRVDESKSNSAFGLRKNI
jgi:hypothetical protein